MECPECECEFQDKDLVSEVFPEAIVVRVFCSGCRKVFSAELRQEDLEEEE